MREGGRSHFGCPALEIKCYGRLHSITQCERVCASMCVCVCVHVRVWHAECAALCVCDTVCNRICVCRRQKDNLCTYTYVSLQGGRCLGVLKHPRTFGAKDDSRSSLLHGRNKNLSEKAKGSTTVAENSTKATNLEGGADMKSLASFPGPMRPLPRPRAPRALRGESWAGLGWERDRSMARV